MSNQLIIHGGSEDGYSISRSLRLRSSASGYLSKTFGAAGNRKKWTYSCWIKRGTLGTYGSLIASKVDGNNYSSLEFSGNELRFVQALGGSITVNKRPVALFRDPAAWYHIIAVMDTDNATAEDRFILYVNGVRVTAWASNTAPSLGLATGYINSTTAQWIGLDANPLYFDGYLADVNFVDGLAQSASSFGEIDPLTGVWKAKAYGGSRGTNGYYLTFSDNSAATAAAIGKDSSGNGNNWTPNNISLSAGSTYDSMLDVPTLSKSASNYATLNPLWKLGSGGYITPTNGNLKASSPGNNIIASTIPVPATGKWYMEFTLTTSVYPEFGMARATSVGGGSANTVFAAYNNGSNLWLGDGSYGSTDGNQANTSGDIGLIAVDVDNNKLWIGRSRSGTVVWMGGGNPSSGTSPSFSASGGGGVYATTFDAQTFNNPFVGSGGGSDVWDVNFGQQPWVATPPTGFKALNTFNLPDPTIKLGNKHFDALTYTGNGSSSQRTDISWANIQPDFVWLKNRSSANNHVLHDNVRGCAEALQSNLTNAVDGPVGFGSDGFGFGGVANQLRIWTADGRYNTNGNSYVAWGWKASGASPVSNTAGSITSQVSANASAGFSVVTYTGSGSNGTVGHGLGVAPKMIFVKDRTQGGTYRDWAVYNSSIGAGNALYLNSSSSSFSKPSYWNSTTATSSVFSLGSDITVNQSGDAYVAYCFSEVAGYSKFGSYTGNGSTDGTFVHLGFRPKFVMIKCSTNAYNWVMTDTSRDSYNTAERGLYPNLSNVEGSGYPYMDILSNGFKQRYAGGGTNASGETFIYMAFAENPFKHSLAR